jgi:hypothetical protein
MKTPRYRAIALLALTASLVAPSSTGPMAKGCGLGFARDSIVERLDSAQSAGAAKICAIYLNTAAARDAG